MAVFFRVWLFGRDDRLGHPIGRLMNELFSRNNRTMGTIVPTGRINFGGGGICRDALRASMAPSERGPTENPNPMARPRPRRSGALQKIQTLWRVHGSDGAGPYRKFNLQRARSG